MDTGYFLQDITDRYGLTDRQAHTILHMYGILRDAYKVRTYSGQKRRMPAYPKARVDEVFPKHLEWAAGEDDIVFELPVCCTANDAGRILHIDPRSARKMMTDLRLRRHEAFGYVMYDVGEDGWKRMLDY